MIVTAVQCAGTISDVVFSRCIVRIVVKYMHLMVHTVTDNKYWTNSDSE